MNKQVIFNVGAGLSSYIDTDDKKILIDIGNSSEFSPITDFLVPLFKKRGDKKGDKEETKNKYVIDQLFISHPHDDHISAIENFHKYIYPTLLTTPNDNKGMKENEKINWKLVDNRTDKFTKYLRENLLPKRKPPLISSDPYKLFLYYIPPKECEASDDLDKTHYTNNISLAIFLIIKNHMIFLPGDLMKDSMKYIIKRNSSLRNKLRDGVDFLLAPHHGLKSSFSTYLFQHMKNHKTKRLNIISETTTSQDSNRVVDTRYSTEEYCEGKNNLSSPSSKVYQRKTSNGHIVIDYSSTIPFVKIIPTSSTKALINEFLP